MFELPLFPLNTVLFPGMPLHLTIFEERYRVMLQHVLKTNYTFGVNLIKSGMEALGPLPEPHMVGCTARVIGVEPQKDGTLNVSAVGDERFRILRLGSSQPYLTAFVESIPLKAHHTMDVVRGTHVLRRQLKRYLTLLTHHAQSGDGEESTDGKLTLGLNLSEVQMPEDPMMLIYLSAALLQVPGVEKQPLLEADTAALLLEAVLRMFRRELCVLPHVLDTDEDQARGSAAMN